MTATAKPHRIDTEKIDTTTLEGFMRDIKAILKALDLTVWDDDGDDGRWEPIRHLYMDEEEGTKH